MGLDESLKSRDAPEAQAADEQTPSGRRKRKMTSQVWSLFRTPPTGRRCKKQCKYVKSGAIYMCDNSCGIGTLRRHILNCSRRDTCDVDQLLLSKSGGLVATWSSKIVVGKFHEFLIVSIIKHDLPFHLNKKVLRL